MLRSVLARGAARACGGRVAAAAAAHGGLVPPAAGARFAAAFGAAAVGAVRAGRATATPRPVAAAARGFAAQGGGPASLEEALTDEIAHEADATPAELPAPPAPFKLVDFPGSSEVVLERPFGDGETVTVSLSVTDQAEEDLDDGVFDGDSSDSDEELGEREDSDDDGDEDEEELVFFTVQVAKEDGALTFECCTDGEFVDIRDVALDTVAQAELDAVAYRGPEFETLDDAVQAEFYKYIELRGVDKELAEYVVDLFHEKEQSEYVRWLKAAHAFVKTSNFD